MRSSRSALLVVVVALALPGCGVDADTGDTNQHTDDLDCASSYLTYENFGAPFLSNWCRGCHSSGLPADMRQMAPPEANFDNLDEIRTWGDGMVSLAGGDPAKMPPAGGPSVDERQLLVEWIECGAK